MLIQESAMHVHRLCNEVMGVLRETHRRLGPGRSPVEYREALNSALRECELPFDQNIWLPERYKGFTLMFGDNLDFVIDGAVAIQILSDDGLTRAHETRFQENLAQMGLQVGYLINFHARHFEEGLRKVFLFQ